MPGLVEMVPVIYDWASDFGMSVAAKRFLPNLVFRNPLEDQAAVGPNGATVKLGVPAPFVVTNDATAGATASNVTYTQPNITQVVTVVIDAMPAVNMVISDWQATTAEEAANHLISKFLGGAAEALIDNFAQRLAELITPANFATNALVPHEVNNLVTFNQIVDAKGKLRTQKINVDDPQNMSIVINAETFDRFSAQPEFNRADYIGPTGAESYRQSGVVYTATGVPCYPEYNLPDVPVNGALPIRRIGAVLHRHSLVMCVRPITIPINFVTGQPSGIIVPINGWPFRLMGDFDVNSKSMKVSLDCAFGCAPGRPGLLSIITSNKVV